MSWLPEYLILPIQIAYLSLLIATLIRIAVEKDLSRGWKAVWFFLALAVPIVAMLYWYANMGNSNRLTFGQDLK